MTANAFLKRLLLGLDFLSEDDKKIVLQFYQKKLSNASTLTEEETIVKSFGSPEHIAAKLKETYDKFQSAEEEKKEELPEQSAEETVEEEKIAEETVENEICQDELESQENVACEEQTEDAPTTTNEDENDLIFSRPTHQDPAPEYIHSLENKEVKTLYGEKVEIEAVEVEKSIPEEDNDGLSREEVESAKAATLEKATLLAEEMEHEASDFEPSEEKAEEPSEPDAATINDTAENENSSAEEELPSSDEEKPVEAINEALEISDEEELSEEEELPEAQEAVRKPIPSLMNRLAPSMSKSSALTLSIILSILFLPLTLAAFILPTVLFVALSAVILVVAVLLFAIMVALIAAAVLELIYGFSLFSEAVSIALVEIGLGIVVLSIVTAITALIYEYLFALVPKLIKIFGRWFKIAIKSVFCFLYGGKK